MSSNPSSPEPHIDKVTDRISTERPSDAPEQSQRPWFSAASGALKFLAFAAAAGLFFLIDPLGVWADDDEGVVHASSSVLWGIDPNEGHLFVIGDLAHARQTFLDFGPVHIHEGDSFVPITAPIESFTITHDDHAIMVVNGDLGGLAAPVLVSIDLAAVTTGHAPVVVVIGSASEALGSAENIRIVSLAADPVYDSFYALGQVSQSDADSGIGMIFTASINRDNSLGLTLVGPIRRMNENLPVVGRDLCYGPGGMLLVAGAGSQSMLLIEPTSGTAIKDLERWASVFDDSAMPDIHALAWDRSTERAVLYDSISGLLVIDSIHEPEPWTIDILSLGLGDIIGMDFSSSLPMPSN